MAAAKDRIASIPSLRPDYDPSLLALSPAEGFLYSRIDGATPWKLLREIGGLSPDEVDLCLESWAATGLLDLREPAPERKKLVTHTSERGAHKVPRGPELSALDEGIDIDLDSQRRILEFEARLDEPYHELLGLERDFDTKMIKKAYFKLSKEFHPDRFFRRNVGGFGKRMEKIFKRISEAYELLSDPTVRAEIDKSMTAAAAESAASTPLPTAGGGPSAPSRPLTKIERLRARMPFKLPESYLTERRARAREFWDSAQRSVQIGQPLEGASAIRLALAFDPFNDEYREGFGEVQARTAEMRAEKLVAEAESAAGSGIGDETVFRDVLRLYEEALLYRPHAPELNEKAARAALGCGQVGKAEEYAERAFEHSPDVVGYRVVRALVHKARGNVGHAINELEKARELAPDDEEASALLAKLRRSSRPQD